MEMLASVSQSSVALHLYVVDYRRSVMCWLACYVRMNMRRNYFCRILCCLDK